MYLLEADTILSCIFMLQSFDMKKNNSLKLWSKLIHLITKPSHSCGSNVAGIIIVTFIGIIALVAKAICENGLYLHKETPTIVANMPLVSSWWWFKANSFDIYILADRYRFIYLVPSDTYNPIHEDCDWPIMTSSHGRFSALLAFCTGVFSDHWWGSLTNDQNWWPWCFLCCLA